MEEMENWQIILTFVYPHEAHFAKAYLASEGVESEIRDELTAQVNNFYSNAIGGVKLLVKVHDYERGIELLKKGGYILDPGTEERKIELVHAEKGLNTEVCPFCKSENISIKKVPGIWTVILIFFFGAAFPLLNKSYTCFDCEKEWKLLKK